ncbi:MAG: hypothetical protein R3F65_28045 [bacterium]|nr:hypothetical protein [Myxococcales bacterium]MCB9552567.1 hypothetical protein [Myxococcales bacterium]
MDKVTLELDPSLAARLEAFAASTGRSPPRLIADLLDAATAFVGSAVATRPPPPANRPVAWSSWPIGVQIDLTDKEALHRILDESLIESLTRHREEE